MSTRRKVDTAPQPSVLQSVNMAAKVPLYQQIYLILRDQIISGDYKAGSVLPSEAEISRQYSVSRITAKQALTEVANAGMAKRYRGRGTVVEEVRQLPPLRASVSDWMSFAVTMGRTTQVRVIEMRNGAANVDEAGALELPADAPVNRWLRVRQHRNEPFSVLHTVVPDEIGADITREELEQTPLLDLIQQRGHRIGEARQVITATLADQSNAALLDLAVGSPLLKLIRIVYDTDRRPVEFLTALYRPDRYQLEIVLSPENKVLRLGNPLEDVFGESPLS